MPLSVSAVKMELLKKDQRYKSFDICHNGTSFLMRQLFFTGQTWLLTILHLMDNVDKLEKGETVQAQDRSSVPFFEMSNPARGPPGYKLAAETPDPRTIKSHLPLCYWKDALEKCPGTKVIQTIRNPKDTLVSLYHFCRMNKNLGCFHGTWDQFFQTAVCKESIKGDLFKITVDWYSFSKARDNSLILVYEEMKKDLRGNIKKLSDFLERDLSEEIIDIIAEKTTFENMSKDPNLNKRNIPIFKEERSTFFRKGKVGDWKEYFNEEQNEYIETKSKEFFDPVGLKFEYM